MNCILILITIHFLTDGRADEETNGRRDVSNHRKTLDSRLGFRNKAVVVKIT